MTDLLTNLQLRYFGRESRFWLRPFIILAVLLGSFFLGREASISLIIFLIAIITALVFLRVPPLAIFPIILGSFLIRSELGTGTQSSINSTMILVAMLLGLWALEIFSKQRKLYLFYSRVYAPLFGLTIVAILSFIAGQLPWFTFAAPVSILAQLGGLVLFLLSAGAFLWVSQYITDIKWLQWMVWVFLGIGGVYMLGKLLVGDQIGRIIVNEATGSMFWTWFAAIAASQAVFNRNLKPSHRFLVGLLVAITLVAGWRNRQWASGWLPSMLAVLVVIFLLNWRIGLFSALILTGAFLFLNIDLAREFSAGDWYSLFTRQAAWKIVLGEIVRVNPILGLGPSNYYNYTPLFPILGYAVRFNSHNQYIDLIAQTGFLGLFMYLWLAFEVGRLSWRMIGRAAPGFEKAYVVGVLGGLAGTRVYRQRDDT